HLAQLEAVGLDDVLLFGRAHALEEQPRLREMVAERLAALADLVRIDALLVALETAVLRGRWGFLRPAAVDGVGLVRSPPLVDGHAVHGVALAAVVRRHRPVDRDFMEVRPA